MECIKCNKAFRGSTQFCSGSCQKQYYEADKKKEARLLKLRARKTIRKLIRKKGRKGAMKIAQMLLAEELLVKRWSANQKPKYKTGMGASFYKTREWVELRYEAIKKHGRTCMSCGSRKGAVHVDHIKPRSIHPELELDPENLQILCEDCNLGKTNKDSTDWKPKRLYKGDITL